MRINNKVAAIISKVFVLFCKIVFQYAGPGNRNSTTTLVGPSPAPGLCMHMFRRAMPLWRVRREDEVAEGVVGA